MTDSFSPREFAQQPHYLAGWVLLQNRAVFEQLGLEVPLAQRLGRGSFGQAYRVPLLGGSVLKITRDPTEAEAAVLLRGRAVRRIVRVHNVWAIRGTVRPGWRGWYCIHRDMLEPLKPRDKLLVETIFSLYDDMDLDLTIPRSAQAHSMMSKWRSYLRDSLVNGDVAADEEGRALGSRDVGKLVERSLILLTQIGEAVDEMHRAGIDWEDISSDNMMRTATGLLVIGDIGCGALHEDFEAEIPYLTSDAVRSHLSEMPASVAR